MNQPDMTSLESELRAFVTAFLDSYDDTGCEDCGVVDQSVHRRAEALQVQIQTEKTTHTLHKPDQSTNPNP